MSRNLNLTRAENILGFGVDILKNSDGIWEASCNWEMGVESATGPTRGEALWSLVEQVYNLRATEVRKRQKHRCAECGRLGPTEIDHIVPRARGRDDRIENLRAVCPSGFGCGVHQRKHG